MFVLYFLYVAWFACKYDLYAKNDEPKWIANEGSCQEKNTIRNICKA